MEEEEAKTKRNKAATSEARAILKRI